MKLFILLLPLVVVATNGKDLLQDEPEDSADKGMDLSDVEPKHLPYQAISDVDSHSLHNVHQNINKESLKGRNGSRKKKTNQCIAKLHKNSTLYEQVDSSEIAITDTVNQVNSSLYNKVDTSETAIKDTIYEVCSNNTGCCPSGFFMMPLGPQCFKLLNDKRRTYMEAKDACNNIGLVMARPVDPVMLRIYIMGKYSRVPGKHSPFIWVAARGGGSGSTFFWDQQVGGGEIPSDYAYWEPDFPGSKIGSRYCIYLENEFGNMKRRPQTAYRSFDCNDRTYFFALCEFIKE